jgi:hypothetical protein
MEVWLRNVNDAVHEMLTVKQLGTTRMMMIINILDMPQSTIMMTVMLLTKTLVITKISTVKGSCQLSSRCNLCKKIVL